MGDSADDSATLESNKLEQKMKSLEELKRNINNQVWNAKTSYYTSLGEAGISELDNIKKKELTKDFQKKEQQYDQMMENLYSRYYDKLSVLYTQKLMTNKQIEIINNTQYKILEHRDVENKLTNELTTKNREREYLNTISRNERKQLRIYSTLLGFLFITIIIIFSINYSSLGGSEGWGRVLYSILSDSNKQFFPIYLIIVLFIIIVLRQFTLAILLLVFYSLITLFTDIETNESVFANILKDSK